jgi:hypothetical protein
MTSTGQQAEGYAPVNGLRMYWRSLRDLDRAPGLATAAPAGSGSTT